MGSLTKCDDEGLGKVLGARKLLLPAFTRTAVATQEPATRAFCHALIDAFEGRDVVDAPAA